MERTGATLVRSLRLVPIAPDDRAGRSPDPVDLRIVDGVIAELAPRLIPRAEDLLVEAAGRWAVPGLWDSHLHLGQWAQARRRLDLRGTASAGEALRRVGTEAERRRRAGDSASMIIGSGHQSATWPEPPTVSRLDGTCGDRPVVLISGDTHNGWLNSAALARLGVGRRDDALVESDWFAVLERLSDLPEARAERDHGYPEVVAEAAGRAWSASSTSNTRTA